jgi:hypothetical protein
LAVIIILRATAKQAVVILIPQQHKCATVACNFMSAFKTFVVFLLTLLTISCNDKNSIVGVWRRTDFRGYYGSSDTNKIKPGDLIIQSDSTFFIKGSIKPDTSHIAGWHSGDDMHGTWTRPDKHHFILVPNGIDKKLGLAFNIISLDEKNLVVSLNFAGTKTNAIIVKYIKI